MNSSIIPEDLVPEIGFFTFEILVAGSSTVAVVLLGVLIFCICRRWRGTSGKIFLPPSESPQAAPGKIRASLRAFEDRTADEVETEVGIDGNMSNTSGWPPPSLASARGNQRQESQNAGGGIACSSSTPPSSKARNMDSDGRRPRFPTMEETLPQPPCAVGADSAAEDVGIPRPVPSPPPLDQLPAMLRPSPPRQPPPLMQAHASAY